MSINSLKARRILRKYAPGGTVGEPTKFENGMQKTGQVTGLVGTIRSAVNQVAEPIRYNSEQVDPTTGTYKNKDKAIRMGTFGSQLDPMRAASDTFKDPNASSGEKWAAGLNLLSPNPFASNALSKRRYNRLEAENQTKVYKDKMQTWGGASENPYGSMMPYGGQVKSETVELEQGEPYMLPDGSIDSIPTNAPTHAQGGVPIDLPVGTKVLGKKKAFQDKEFKQLGRKLESMQKKYDKALDSNPTGLAANTAKRMLKNIQGDYNKLFQAQGVDVGGQQFAEGGTVYENDPDMALDIKTRPYTERTVYQQFTHPETGKPFYPVKPTIRNTQNTNVFELEQGIYGTYQPYLEGSNKWDIDYEPSVKRTYGDVQGDVKFFEPTGYEKFSKGGKVMRKGADGLKAIKPRSGYIDPLEIEDVQPQYSSTIQAQEPTYNTSGKSYNPTNTITSIGALAPVMYNIGQGLRKEEQLNPRDYLNPYANEARQAMRNRRFDIQPQLNNIDTDTATYYRQLKEGNLNPSLYLGGMQAASINKTRAKAALSAQEQNVNAGYLADQAQMDLGIGRDIAQTKMAVQDINDRNSAARRNYMSAGMSQLGQYAQIKQQENNMMIRDAQRLQLLSALVKDYILQPDGSWKHRSTGQVMDSTQTWDNLIKGNNARN